MLQHFHICLNKPHYAKTLLGIEDQVETGQNKKSYSNWLKMIYKPGLIWPPYTDGHSDQIGQKICYHILSSWVTTT